MSQSILRTHLERRAVAAAAAIADEVEGVCVLGQQRARAADAHYQTRELEVMALFDQSACQRQRLGVGLRDDDRVTAPQEWRQVGQHAAHHAAWATMRWSIRRPISPPLKPSTPASTSSVC